MNLFEISADLHELNRALEELGDQPIEETFGALDEWLNSLLSEKLTEREAKLDNYAALISEIEARAQVRKNEAKRLADLAQTDANQANALKDRLKVFFDLHGLKTVQTARYKLSLANNGGKVPVLFDDLPIEEIPAEYIVTKQVIELDKVWVERFWSLARLWSLPD